MEFLFIIPISILKGICRTISHDRRIGKWENLLPCNGQIESEEYYRNGYFLKNYWDSAGVQQVKDGLGRVIKKYNNGVVAEEGAYRNGRQQDLWVGHHRNGELFFEEFYIDGRLTKGRSQNRQGKNFVYDESSFLRYARNWKK